MKLSNNNKISRRRLLSKALMAGSGALVGLTISPIGAAQPLLAQTTVPPLERKPYFEAPRFGTVIIRPWLEFQENGHPSGILMDLLMAISEESRLPYRNSIQPHKRILKSMATGQIDFAALLDSPILEDSSERIAHIIDMDVLAITQPKILPLSSVSDLQGLKVGVIRGATYGPDITQAQHFQKVDVRGPLEGSKLLMAKQIDVLVGTNYSMEEATTELQKHNAELSSPYVIKKITAGLYISKFSSRRDLIPTYQRALQKLRADGRLDRIFRVNEIRRRH